MARPIDAYQAIDIIDEWLDSVGTVMVGHGLSSYGELIGCIEDTPTITPPEIVCCQDCVHHEDGYAHWCNKWEHICPDDSEFFCKYGRKKNDSTTD